MFRECKAILFLHRDSACRSRRLMYVTAVRIYSSFVLSLHCHPLVRIEQRKSDGRPYRRKVSFPFRHPRPVLTWTSLLRLCGISPVYSLELHCLRDS